MTRKHDADLIPLYPEGYDANGKPCIARLFSYQKPLTFLERLKLAYEVFAEKADVVTFKAQETEEEFKRTPRYATWKRYNK